MITLSMHWKNALRAAFCLIALTVPLVFSAHSAESGREKVALAYAAISPSTAGVWMAKEIGAFERHGLNVDLVHISSGAVAIQALVGVAFERL